MKYLLLSAFLIPLSTVTFTLAQDTEPVLQNSAKYSLPQSAIDADIDGTVVVGLQIDETGNVTEVAVVSGPMWPCGATPSKAIEDISSTLTATMKTLKFSPATKKGKPVSKAMTLKLELKNPNMAPKPPEINPVTGKPKPGMISAGVLNGKAKSLPKPEYPDKARETRAGGSVVIQVVIDEKGDVIRAGGISGPAVLQYESREAACRAKFAPLLLQGNPIKVSGAITYNFIP